jgi:hypothetical protein
LESEEWPSEAEEIDGSLDLDVERGEGLQAQTVLGCEAVGEECVGGGRVQEAARGSARPGGGLG